jgi:2,3-bisphosphoglycerate-dependent phosphoglycerate mutase
MLIIFEAHATTIDNEAEVASGWNDVALSKKGEEQARELGKRYDLEDLDAVYCADLQRAYRTAKLAFPKIDPKKLFLDWRLRECDYGNLTLEPSKKLDADKLNRINEPFPGGESYNGAMRRMKSFIDDLERSGFKKVLIVGSRATQYGLDHWIDGKKLEDLLSHKMVWQPGWQYKLFQNTEPATSRAVCSVVIEKDNKYLLVQEKQVRVYGKWNFPGGHVDEGETLEQAATREAREEVGYKVKILQQLFVRHQSIDRPALHAYRAEIISGELHYPEDEILDARWFSYQEILVMKSDLRDSDYIIGALKAVGNP